MQVDWSPLWISLRTAGLATIATFFLGTAAAYAMLGYRGRWKPLIEGVLIAPLILPPTVVGFLLLLLFGKNGWLGQLMQAFDFSIVFTWYAGVVTATVVAFPLMYKTALGAFEQIDSSLLQVAQTLGASEVRIFRQVLLPLAAPGLLAGVTLAFARALGEFGATLMLAGNIPGQTQTMPMAIYFAVEAGDRSLAWLWSIVILTLSLSGLIAVNRWQQVGQRHPQTGQIEADEPIDRGGRRSAPAALRHRPKPQLLDSNSGLLVEIEKQLASFRLDTAFTAQPGNLQSGTLQPGNLQPGNLGILGGSGSGKSMMLRCIAGIETPTQGRIVLNGKTLFDRDRHINLPSHQRNVGLVFQNYALFPHLTVSQNIAFGLQHLPRSRRSQCVQQQLAAVQMQELGDRYPHQLSGGQQQRIALARALAPEPEALLLDEPFSALDTYLRAQMERQLLQTLSTYRGITLFVTHNLEEAYRICDRLLVMSGGVPIAHDCKQRIFEHPQTVRVAQLTGCKNFSRAVTQSANSIRAIDWDITLQVIEAIPDSFTDVGIRAHQVKLAIAPHTPNTYPCWLAATSETPHRMTLLLKFHAPPKDAQDYHLQAEVFKEKWQAIKDQPFPWHVQLEPSRLMLMTDG